MSRPAGSAAPLGTWLVCTARNSVIEPTTLPEPPLAAPTPASRRSGVRLAIVGLAVVAVVVLADVGTALVGKFTAVKNAL